MKTSVIRCPQPKNVFKYKNNEILIPIFKFSTNNWSSQHILNPEYRKSETSSRFCLELSSNINRTYHLRIDSESSYQVNKMIIKGLIIRTMSAGLHCANEFCSNERMRPFKEPSIKCIQKRTNDYPYAYCCKSR